jgi:hypothetical protein
MAATINAIGAKEVANTLFNKLDTQRKGYIEVQDIAAAAGEGANADHAAEIFKRLDGDSDGRVTKSELSEAVEKVGNELNAQLDQSRVAAAPTGRPPGGGGAPPPKPADSDSETEISYVAAADTDNDGTVSEAEDAAYKKAQAQASQYTSLEAADSAQASSVDIEA